MYRNENFGKSVISTSTTCMILKAIQKTGAMQVRHNDKVFSSLLFHYIQSPDSDPGTESGQFGNYSCDGTRLTLLSAIETMRVVESQPDFILWTGDSAPHWHEPSDPNWDYIFKAEKDIVSRLREAFPHTQILPALGNHDSFPADFFPGSSKDFFKIPIKSHCRISII